MSTPIVKIELSGFKEVQESLSQTKIDSAIAKGVGFAILSIHKTLSLEVKNEYNFKESLDTVLIGKSSSTVKTGKNFIEAGLEYKTKYRDLSKFSPSWSWGNINPSARRPGRVHTVEVRRGKRVTVYGKEHRGGFMPRDKNGTAKRIFRGGTQMYERTSKSKLPLRLLLGPSLSMAAKRTFDHSKKMQSYSDTVINLLVQNLSL